METRDYLQKDQYGKFTPKKFMGELNLTRRKIKKSCGKEQISS